MVRIGNFDEAENPEKGSTSKVINENTSPSSIDRQKLERPSDNTDKFKSIKTDSPSSNEGKEKLNTTRPDERAVEKKQPENIESNLNNYFSDLKKTFRLP